MIFCIHKLVNVALKADGAKNTLDVTLNQTPQVPPMLAVEGPYYAWFGVPEVTREAKAIRYAVPMRVDKEKSLAGNTLRGAPAVGARDSPDGPSIAPQAASEREPVISRLR